MSYHLTSSAARLQSSYNNYATSIKATGGGLDPEFEMMGQVPKGELTGWIATVPREGPTIDTPEPAKNLWRKSIDCFTALQFLICHIRAN